MSQHTYKKYIYHQPIATLLTYYVEDSVCDASATITIGDPGQEYTPNIEDWTEGYNAKVNREF
jgi:hypothetical protein